jgi:fucose 4-O-acetylase-like acetyltransferase
LLAAVIIADTRRCTEPTHAEDVTIEQTADIKPANTRDPIIDGLKFAAAGAIVMVHVAMHGGSTALAAFAEQISYSALFFFFLVSGYFHGATGTRGPRWLSRRFVRLMVPYFVRSFVFVAWWNLYHVANDWPLYFPKPVRFIFFAGGAEVLWSLPWLFVCALIAETLARTTRARRVLIVSSLLIQLGVWVFVTPAHMPHYAIRQFINGGRWVFTYLLGMELRGMQTVPGSPGTWGATALVTAMTAGALATFTGAQPTTFAPELAMFSLNATAALALLAGARTGTRWFGVGRLAWGGDYLLGVYVSHGLWVAMLVRVMPVASMPVGLWLAAAWAICLAVAVLVTKLLLSSRATRLSVT